MMPWFVKLGAAEYDLDDLPGDWFVPIAELDETSNWYGVSSNPIDSPSRARRIVEKLATEKAAEVKLPDEPMSAKASRAFILRFFRYKDEDSRPKAGTKRGSRSTADAPATNS
jgi:hypothetical protein